MRVTLQDNDAMVHSHNFSWINKVMNYPGKRHAVYKQNQPVSLSESDFAQLTDS